MHKPMRIMFPAPFLAADGDEDAEAEIRELFGITEEPAADPPPADPSATTTDPETPPAEPAADPAPTQTEDPPQPNVDTQKPQGDAPVNPEDKFTKQNFAFAQMRTENRALSELIMNLAKATGQTPKNITEAQDILKEGLTKVVSKNRNIPEDVLREMEDDKRALAELRQTQARQKALSGFQQVKDTFNLTREEVNAYADKLVEQQINPFEQEVDLVKEYRNMYFEAEIAKAVERGVQQERARALKAAQNSTTPPTKTGNSDGTGTQGKPIQNVSDLDKLLDSLK